jgi:hypothetical protein
LPGLSGSDFGPALEHFLGSVTGLSVAMNTRLTGGWHDEAVTLSRSSGPNSWVRYKANTRSVSAW